MDYKIGDKVVYPNHGVGVVEQMSFGVLNGRTERYYMIRIVSSGLRVMVPHTNAIAVGLRSVIRSNDTSKVLGFLEKGKLNSHHDWKHRFKENSERMRTGSLWKSPWSSRVWSPSAVASHSPSAKRKCSNAPSICWSAKWPPRAILPPRAPRLWW